MRLIVVSGLSGSGKSVALAMLEDLDFYCVDNLPAGLLPAMIAYTVRSKEADYRRTAVGIDARNRPEDLADVPRLVDELRRSGIACELFFLRAENEVLSSASAKRAAGTRCRVPASGCRRRSRPSAACSPRSPTRPISRSTPHGFRCMSCAN